ncbi:dihydroxyacetone phosphate acyltransferase-like [Polymixia lowei]
MALDELTEQAIWLRGLSREHGAFLHWPDHVPPSEVVSSSLSLHRGLVRLSDGRVWLAAGEAEQAGPGEPRSDVSPEERLFSQAVIVLSCASYRNQVLHVFLRPALLATAIHTASSTKKEEVYNSFSFLRNMFSNEFILCPGAAVQDFEEACYVLVKTGVLQASQQEVVVTERGHRTLAFLTTMLDPFLQGYQVVCRYLCEEATEGLTEKQFVPAVRNFIVKLILAGSLRYCEVLSSDLQKNALAALLRLGAVRKVKGVDQVTLKVNKMMVNSLEDTLGGKLPTQKAVLARL